MERNQGRGHPFLDHFLVEFNSPTILLFFPSITFEKLLVLYLDWTDCCSQSDQVYLNMKIRTDMIQMETNGVDIAGPDNAFPDRKERRKGSCTKSFDSISAMKEEIPKQPFSVYKRGKTKKKKKESKKKSNHPPLCSKDIGLNELKDLMDAATTRVKIIEASRGQKIRDEEIEYIVKDVVVGTQNHDDSMTETTEQHEALENQEKRRSLFTTDPTLKTLLVSMMTILLQQRFYVEKSESLPGPTNRSHQTNGFPSLEVITTDSSGTSSSDAFQPSINTTLSNLSHLHHRDISSTTDKTACTFVNADHNDPCDDPHTTMAHEDGIEHTMEELQTMVSAVNAELEEDTENETSVLSGETEMDWDDSESECETENEPGPFESAVEKMLWYFDSRMGLQADAEKSIQTEDGNLSADDDIDENEMGSVDDDVAEDEMGSVDEHMPLSTTQAPPQTLFSVFFGTGKSCENKDPVEIDVINNDLDCLSESLQTTIHGVDLTKTIRDDKIDDLPPVFQSALENTENYKKGVAISKSDNRIVGRSSLHVNSEGETNCGEHEIMDKSAGTKSVQPSSYFFGFFGSSSVKDAEQLVESTITELDESFESTLEDQPTSTTSDVKLRQTKSDCFAPTDTSSSKKCSVILVDDNESVKKCAWESHTIDGTFQTTEAVSAVEAALKAPVFTSAPTERHPPSTIISTKIMVVYSPKSEGIQKDVPKALNNQRSAHSDQRSAHSDNESVHPTVIADLNDSTDAAWDWLECTTQDLTIATVETNSLDSESAGKFCSKIPNSGEGRNNENMYPMSSNEERTLGSDPSLIGNMTRSGEQCTLQIDQEKTSIHLSCDAGSTSQDKEEQTCIHQQRDGEKTLKHKQEQTRINQHWDAEARRRRRRHRKPQSISTVLTSDHNVAVQQVTQKSLVNLSSTLNDEDQLVHGEVSTIEESTSICDKECFKHDVKNDKSNLQDKSKQIVSEPDLLLTLIEEGEDRHHPKSRSSSEDLSPLGAHSTKGVLYGVLSSSDTKTKTAVNIGNAVSTGRQEFTSNTSMQGTKENWNQYPAKDTKVVRRGIHAYMLGKAHMKRAVRKKLCQAKPETN